MKESGRYFCVVGRSVYYLHSRLVMEDEMEVSKLSATLWILMMQGISPVLGDGAISRCMLFTVKVDGCNLFFFGVVEASHPP